MVVVPAATPVTNPVALIVATAVFDEVHAFTAAGEAEPFNCLVAPIQADKVPPIVGNALTVTALVFEHPLASVNVIVAIPAETPVTSPLPFTVAIAVFDELHAFVAAGVPVPNNCVVPLIQIALGPDTVGNAFTVNVTEPVHPFVFV